MLSAANTLPQPIPYLPAPPEPATSDIDAINHGRALALQQQSIESLLRQAARTQSISHW